MTQLALDLLIRNLLEYTSIVNPIILYGDFNLPDLSWYDYSSGTPENQRFLDSMADNDLIQIVDLPTAATGILDLFIVSKDLEVASFKLGGVQKNSLYNHCSISTVYEFQIVLFYIRKPKTVFRYCNGDFDRLNALIDEKPLSGLCWGNVNVLIEQWLIGLTSSFSRQPSVGRSIGRICRIRLLLVLRM